MTTFLRSSRVVFRFWGEDAHKLLFDVVTGHLLAEEGPAVWWALLSPQGKVQAEGLCVWSEGSLWLDVDAAVANEFHRRMRMYKLRAKVEIEDLRETHVVGWSDEPGGSGIVRADARAPGLGSHIIAPAANVVWSTDEAPFRTARIANGVAELGPDFGPDEVFPHDIGMDLLGGVDFKKGCYVGQEVVSRMQHRGTARRRPVIVAGLPDGAAMGAQVMAGEREAGALGAVAAGKAVAILRLDRITDPGSVTVAGEPVALKLPDWGTYRFGESGAAD